MTIAYFSHNFKPLKVAKIVFCGYTLFKTGIHLRKRFDLENRKKAPAGFYSAREAIEAIGIPPSSFYHLVRAGTIKGTKLPGKKEAIYPKDAIDRYARAIQAHIERFTRDTFSFGIALKEDLPEIRALIAANFKVVPPVPESIMEAWIRQNPEALHVLRRGNEIVGYVAMWPMSNDTIMRRMRGEILHRSIPIDDIQPYIPGKSIQIYFADAIVSSEENKQSKLGARLMLEVARFLYRLAEQDIRITEIYTVGTTAYGIRLCRSLNMTPLELETGIREDRIPFVLDIEKSDAPMVVEYRRILHATQIL